MMTPDPESPHMPLSPSHRARFAAAGKQLHKYRSDATSVDLPAAPPTKRADGPIRSSRIYNIVISVIVMMDAIVSFYADYSFEISDGRRRLIGLEVPEMDSLLTSENMQVLLAGLLLLGGNLTFVKVYLFRRTSYWEGPGNLFEYVFCVQTFLESVGIALPESIGRLSKPVTRLMQSRYCPCVKTTSDSPDHSIDRDDEEAEPLVWKIWGFAVILIALVQTFVTMRNGYSRSLPPCDFGDWSTGGLVLANFQVFLAIVLVFDVLISVYESLGPSTTTYFRDAGNIFELVIAVLNVLASANMKVPPAIGLLVKPTAKCLWKLARIRSKEATQADQKAQDTACHKRFAALDTLNGTDVGLDKTAIGFGKLAAVRSDFDRDEWAV
jgi:hypothetical protein